MNPAVRFAWFLSVVAVSIAACKRPAATNTVPDVQHLGPLIVVAFNEASADPDVLRGDLLGGNKTERMHALQAMGIDSDPELRDLWASFLRSHSGQGDDKGVMQSISGGTDQSNFGDPGSEPIVLDAGFDELTDRPLEFRGIFVSEKGQWRHVATVACQCQMTDMAEPFNPHPGHPDPPQEWVVSLHKRDEGAREYQRTDIRFRVRDHLLRALIQYIGMKETCPSGPFNSPLCTISETSLHPARLLAENGSDIAGYVLISWSGPPPPCDMCGLILRNPKCSAYLWDENAFAYVPSPLRPESCGPALPQKKPPHTIQSPR
jgi:hypothetical protein